MIPQTYELVVANETGTLRSLYVNAVDPEGHRSTKAHINRGNIRPRVLDVLNSHILQNA
jgi:hypothetical protein